ncbi:MAG TPA: hypothetical protein VFQ81_11495, partial [Candidatus Limnocylindria bacterium]|nr:hypothetical protein [Candidatus Limnocylindria bacterium]
MNRRRTDAAVAATLGARVGPDAVRRLRALRRRLWLRRALTAAMPAIATGLAVAALVQLAARTVALEIAPLLHLGVGVITLLAWCAWCAWRRPSLAETARRADEELGLRERVATALELADEERPDGTAGELVDRQLRDARSRLSILDPRTAFRPRLHRRPAMLGVVSLALVATLTVWPNPQDDVLADRRAARAAAEAVAERIEDIAEEAEERGETDDPRRQELVDELERLARQLREDGGDRQETLARIGTVQEALARMTDQQASQKDAALSRLAQEISRAATGNEHANPDGDTEEAARDLEELGDRAGEMQPSEAGQRADALRQAASQ